MVSVDNFIYVRSWVDNHLDNLTLDIWSISMDFVANNNGQLEPEIIQESDVNGLSSTTDTLSSDIEYLSSQIVDLENSPVSSSGGSNSAEISTLSADIETLSSDLTNGQFDPFFDNLTTSGQINVHEIDSVSSAYKKGILIPYYQTPSSGNTTPSIETIIFTRSQFPDLEWFIIFNPNSGPGTAADSNYTEAINICKAYGIKVLGYVNTNLGTIAVSEINTQVQQWAEFYDNIDGIFFDNFPSSYSSSLASTYEQIYNYARYNQGLGYVFVNPGTPPDTQYFSGPRMWDCLNIWEGSTYPVSVDQLYDSNPSFYENQLQRYSGIVNSQSSYSSEQATVLNEYCSLVYVTLSDIYQDLSPYLAELALSLTYVGSDVGTLCSDVEELSTLVEESGTSSISALYAEIGTPIVNSFVSEAVFGGGSTAASVADTSIYVYSSNTTSVGATLTYKDGGVCATGNSITGVFGGGTSTHTKTSLYTYKSNTTAAGSSLTYGGGYKGATGNSTIGVFGGGTPGKSTTSIYTYASNLTLGGGDLTYITEYLGAAGNSTVGVFGAGYHSKSLSTTSLYTYSSNTAKAGTNLTYSARWLAAAGNSTQGVFGGGSSGSAITSVYLYASNQTTSGSKLTYGMGSLAAAGDSTIGIFGGGSSKVSTTSIYTYSNNTTAVGADLTYSPYGLGACSNNNKGVIDASISNPLANQTIFNDLTYLNNQIDTLTQNVDTNTDNIVGVTSEIQSLSSDVNSNTKEIQTLSAQVFIPKNYSGSNLTTTGSILSGSTTLLLSAAIDFENGQGVTVSGAGASGADLQAAQILSGGGTTTLSISLTASSTVDSATVYHDDTVSIQNSLNDAATVYGVVELPLSTPQISSTLNIPNGVALKGQTVQGTQIESYLKSGANATFNGWMIKGVDCTNPTLSNFTLKGPGINALNGSGITYDILNNNDVTGVDFQNLVVVGFPNKCVYLETPVASKLSNVLVQDFAVNGIELYNGTSCVLDACYALTGVGSGFLLRSMTYSAMDGCASEGCGVDYDFLNSNNITLNSSGSEVAQYRNSSSPGIHYRANNSTGIVVNGGYARDFALAETASGSNQYINLTSNSQMTFIGFRGTSATNAPTDTYYIDGTSQVRFIDSKFEGLNSTVYTLELGASIVIESSESQVLSGTTGGTITSVMPQQGLSKVFKAYVNNYENDSAVSQDIVFPMPFINPPVVTQNTTNLSISASTSGISITAPDSTTEYSGYIALEGF